MLACQLSEARPNYRRQTATERGAGWGGGGTGEGGSQGGREQKAAETGDQQTLSRRREKHTRRHFYRQTTFVTADDVCTQRNVDNIGGIPRGYLTLSIVYTALPIARPQCAATQHAIGLHNDVTQRPSWKKAPILQPRAEKDKCRLEDAFFGIL